MPSAARRARSRWPASALPPRGPAPRPVSCAGPGTASNAPIRATVARTVSRISRIGSSCASGWRIGGFHCGLDSLSDALGGGLQVAVADMGVSQGHPGVGVPEHPRDGGQGNAPGDGLAGHGMPEIVQADVVETGFLPCPAPEVQCVRKGLVWMPRGRETVGACGTRLAGEDGLRGLAQPDPSRPGLGIGEVEAVAVDLRPSELQNLAHPATGEQEQPDDVGLLPAGGPFPDQPIEDAVKSFDLFGGEEPAEFRAGVLRDAPGRAGPGMAFGVGGGS